jgi:hypothetical protein
VHTKAAANQTGQVRSVTPATQGTQAYQHPRPASPTVYSRARRRSGAAGISAAGAAGHTLQSPTVAADAPPCWNEEGAGAGSTSAQRVPPLPAMHRQEAPTARPSTAPPRTLPSTGVSCTNMRQRVLLRRASARLTLALDVCTAQLAASACSWSAVGSTAAQVDARGAALGAARGFLMQHRWDIFHSTSHAAAQLACAGVQLPPAPAGATLLPQHVPPSVWGPLEAACNGLVLLLQPQPDLAAAHHMHPPLNHAVRMPQRPASAVPVAALVLRHSASRSHQAHQRVFGSAQRHLFGDFEAPSVHHK